MTAAQLGAGVSQPTVQGLETSQPDDAIQLKTLRRAAKPSTANWSTLWFQGQLRADL